MLEKSKNDLKNTLDINILKEKNLINKKYLKLKILGSGEIKKNIEISAHFCIKASFNKNRKSWWKNKNS
jgi:ribosomal protein L15